MAHRTLGLSVEQDGLRIAPASFTATAGRQGRVSFRVLDHDGVPVRSGYQVEAQRRLHLIVIRRDLTGYQHLHPAMSAGGTWSAPLRLSEPGAYRVFADFQRECEKHVLAADLLAPGRFQPVALPAPTARASADGYVLRLEAPALHAGDEAPLRFTVSRGGRPVRAIQPYLGARGHLVALRQGDLAYLHGHPEEGADDADAILFAADFPSAGSYRLFLQLRIGGTVQTAGFTVEVAP